MATKGYYTRFQYGNAPTAAGTSLWVDFAKAVEIKLPKIDAKSIETTTLDSPTEFETFVPGFANAGEAEFKVNFDKAQFNTIYGMFKTPLGYRIQFSDGSGGPTSTTGSTFAFDGFIQSIQPGEAKKDGIIEATIMVKISGLPVFTQGT